MQKLAQLDLQNIWHPFTQMRDWLRREPIVIVEGRGSVLRDAHGREYLDANSSIWTNLHGHRHPKINAAITRQLKRISHSSALGLANEPASLLSERLVRAANAGAPEGGRLRKVFFSDDGSTALEVALKLAHQFARRVRGLKKPKFVSMQGAYHGDTVGAVSVGHINLFHSAYGGLLFKTDSVMAPFCYRCPFNRAAPERNDARRYRKCSWECVTKVEQLFAAQKGRGEPYAAFVFEPLMQGAAGMIPQPSGWLARTTEIARAHGAHLIADEVMTGFGRTGVTCHLTSERVEKALRKPADTKLFACTRAGVQPDFLCSPRQRSYRRLPAHGRHTDNAGNLRWIFGQYEEFKTFFHGHSFTGNQLGAAAGLASMELLRTRESVRARARLQQTLDVALQSLWDLPNVGDIRQVGLVAGIELVRNWRTREPFDLRERVGIRVCEAMARKGVLTRPVGNVIVIMPPFCTSPRQARRIVQVLREAIEEVLPSAGGPVRA